MDVEEEMLAFGETAVWVECDVCGRFFELSMRFHWRSNLALDT
jgi:hypothetical protein